MSTKFHKIIANFSSYLISYDYKVKNIVTKYSSLKPYKIIEFSSKLKVNFKSNIP
jgi:hypothetical protein